MSKVDTIRRLQSTISSLESKIESLEEQQQSTADDVLEVSMRADKWQMRYEQMASAAKEQGVTLPELSDRAEDTSSGSGNNNMDLVAQLRKEVSDLKADLREALSDAAVARATAAAIVAGNGDLDAVTQQHSSTITSSDSSYPHKDDTATSGEDDDDDSESQKEEQMALTAELLALSGGIEAKEKMVAQANKERECMEAMRSHFENAVKSLQEEVDSLSEEREDLLSKVKDDGSDNKKIMKKRIDELESRIKELRHKASEHTKSLRLREAAEKKCTQLATEIQAAKKRRVDLQKQLKEQASERRSEKKAAQKEAMKLMRDSNRLKVELEKVKNAAAKQTAVLKRKATEALNKQKREAELQAKKIQQQEQRKHMAALKANAKDNSNKSGNSSDKYSFSNSNSITEERKGELLEWLEQEIESASALKQTRDEIKKQKYLMNDAIAKKVGLSKNSSLSRSTGNLAVNPPTRSMEALDEEIEMRSALVEELEENISDIMKASSSSPRARSPSPRTDSSSSHFMDMNLYQGLTKPEATTVFLDCFDRLLQVKKEIDALQSDHDCKRDKAVHAALIKERRAHEDAIMKLKMEHSQAMMDLLNSTKGSIEQSVRLNSLKSVVDPEFQSSVEEMLSSYLQGCNKVGETLQGDLQEVRQTQEGMKQMVESVASGLFADTKPSSQQMKASKKNSKKRDSSDSILQEIELMEMDDVEEDADNSDDPDWSPSNRTPGPNKRRGRRSADSVNNDSKRSSNGTKSNVAAVKLESAMAPVAEEDKQAAKKQSATVTFSTNDTSLDVSHMSEATEDGDANAKESEPTESVADYASMNVRELKDLLRSRGLLVSGRKSELIERLEEDDRNRLGLSDNLVDLTEDSAGGHNDNNADGDDWVLSSEETTSSGTGRGRGGLKNRDLNKAAVDEATGAKKSSAKVALPSTPPKSTHKNGGWSTKKIASVRRSTIFSSKKPSLSPASSPDSLDSNHAENDENANPSSQQRFRTRRNLGVQLGNAN